MKIAQGDTVLIITGKDRGKTGTVLKVLPASQRIIVAGANMRTKFTKKTPQTAGQRITFEGSMHISNVMILDPKTGKPTRVGFKIDEKTKKKVRIARVSGSPIAKTATAKPKAAAKQEEKTDAKKTTAKKKDTAPAATESQASGALPKKSPFWKKMGFGSEALTEGQDPTAHSTPGADQAARSPEQTHTRATSRATSRGA